MITNARKSAKYAFSFCLVALTLASSLVPQAQASPAKVDFVQGAISAFNNGDLDKAIDQYSEAIKQDPKDWHLYSDRGAVYAQAGATNAALSDFDKAISFNPPSSKPYFNRGRLESELEHRDAAIKDYDVALKMNPSEPMILNNRANDEAALGELSAALADYKKAIKLDNEYAEPYNGLGMLQERLGNDQAALENFNKAIKFDPGFAKAFYNRHRSKLAFGDIAGSIRDLQRCAELYESVGQLELCDQALDDAKVLQRSSTL